MSSQPKYPVEISPPVWMLPDRKGFLEWVQSTFAYSNNSNKTNSTTKTSTTASNNKLFVQQRFVRDYLQEGSPYRGLLLFHGLGVGKSCASIATVEALRAAGKEVVIMTPASLQRSYIEQTLLCGSSDFDPNQKWSLEVRTDNKDVWRRDAANGTEFARLDPDAQDAIRQSLAKVVKHAYTFVNYNGVTAARAKQLTSGPSNFFDGKVVVIDEAHNFVSRVSNNGILSPIYERMMDSPSCKVILLSGTPLINKPNEVAYLVDLAQGYHRVVELALRNTQPIANDEALLAEITLLPGVDRCELSDDSSMLHVKLLPKGFAAVPGKPGFVAPINNANKNASRDESSGDNDEALLNSVRQTVGKHASVHKAAIINKLVLPTIKENFDELFVRHADEFRTSGGLRTMDDGGDFKGHTIINTDTLEKRIIGCVSFFSAYDPALYPTVSGTRLVEVPMSARQFAEYTIKRDEERRKEETARKFRHNKPGANDDDGGSALGQTYRAYSRSICNFVFPEGIPRPYTSDVRKMLIDATPPAQDGDESTSAMMMDPQKFDIAKSAVDKAYKRELLRAIRLMRAKTDALRLDGRLEQHAPKFAKIIRHIQETSRMAVVYSCFKAIEGVGLLSAALKANGWGHLRVTRDERTNEPIFVMDVGDDDMSTTRTDSSKSADSSSISSTSSTSSISSISSLGSRRKTTKSASSSSNYQPSHSAAPTTSGRVFMIYENEELSQVMLNAFNSDISKLPPSAVASLQALYPGTPMDNMHGQLVKVLLLSPSGAEGLNLRNVREVHLMEPFWHLMRLDQVIGRAVRAKSHIELPANERHVDIFMYLTVLTPDQKDTPTIKAKDGGLSSDEFVRNVAIRKKATIDNVLNIMRRASVDCRLHHASHRRMFTYECSRETAPQSDADIGQPTYHIRIEDDVMSGPSGLFGSRRSLKPDHDDRRGLQDKKVSRVSSKLRVVKTRDGTELLLDPETGVLYDASAYRKHGRLEPVSTVPPPA
jgi:hypothetical protein